VPLLIDTNAFCLLGAAGLLDDAVGLFGVDLSGCQRLPALPHMLRKGRLRKHLGDMLSNQLVHVANPIPTIGIPSSDWLDLLRPIQDIDPDDALLLALAAEHGDILLTDDKRALCGVKTVPGAADALSGRIAALNALLLALCDILGPAEVTRRIQPVVSINIELRVCFSAGNPDPRDCLRSYFESLEKDVHPLVLWRP
jgi:hypothetical protein